MEADRLPGKSLWFSWCQASFYVVILSRFEGIFTTGMYSPEIPVSIFTLFYASSLSFVIVLTTSEERYSGSSSFRYRFDYI
jgi:hypothetical protein